MMQVQYKSISSRAMNKKIYRLEAMNSIEIKIMRVHNFAYLQAVKYIYH